MIGIIVMPDSFMHLAKCRILRRDPLHGYTVELIQDHEPYRKGIRTVVPESNFILEDHEKEETNP